MIRRKERVRVGSPAVAAAAGGGDGGKDRCMGPRRGEGWG